MFKKIILMFVNLASLAYSAADKPRLNLSDCLEQKSLAVPGVAMSYLWFARHKVLKVSDMDLATKEWLADSIKPETTALLRCCIGCVAGSNNEHNLIAATALLEDLQQPNAPIWKHPFDERSTPDLKQFVPENEAHKMEGIDVGIVWLRCTDDRRSPFQDLAEHGENEFDKPVLPNSFKNAMMQMLIGLGQNPGNKEPKIEAILQDMLEKQEITSEALSLLDSESRGLGAFHEASYMVLNKERFVAFVAQEFSEK